MWELFLLVKSYLVDGKSKSELAALFMIPFSTVARLLKHWQMRDLNYMEKHLSIKWFHRYFEPIAKFIKYFIKNQKVSFDIKELQRRIRQELNLDVDYSIIRGILKKMFNLSYKKGSPRPQNMNTQRQENLWKLFWREVVNMMKSDTLIINIDEVSISYRTKFNYSWLQKGKSDELLNMWYKGSKTMIMAISSTGYWFASPLATKNNSETFGNFLNKLLLWVKLDLERELSNWIIIIDNSRIHKTRDVLDTFKRSGSNVSFIPPYTPSLAPIELVFNWLKLSLNRQ